MLKQVVYGSKHRANREALEFSRLTSISIIGCVFRDVLPFFCLPNVRTLSATTMMGGKSRPRHAVRPGASNLTSLALRSCRVSSEDLHELLRGLTFLQEFDFSGDPERESPWQPQEGFLFQSGLFNRQESLRRMSLSFPQSTQRMRLGSVSEFSSLENLQKKKWVTLLGVQNQTRLFTEEYLASLIAKSLRTLTLKGKMPTVERAQRASYVDAFLESVRKFARLSDDAEPSHPLVELVLID